MIVADDGGDAGARALGGVAVGRAHGRQWGHGVAVFAVFGAGHVVGCPCRDLAEVLSKARLSRRLQAREVEPGDRTAK